MDTFQVSAMTLGIKCCILLLMVISLYGCAVRQLTPIFRNGEPYVCVALNSEAIFFSKPSSFSENIGRADFGKTYYVFREERDFLLVGEQTPQGWLHKENTDIMSVAPTLILLRANNHSHAGELRVLSAPSPTSRHVSLQSDRQANFWSHRKSGSFVLISDSPVLSRSLVRGWLADNEIVPWHSRLLVNGSPLLSVDEGIISVKTIVGYKEMKTYNSVSKEELYVGLTQDEISTLRFFFDNLLHGSEQHMSFNCQKMKGLAVKVLDATGNNTNDKSFLASIVPGIDDSSYPPSFVTGSQGDMAKDTSDLCRKDHLVEAIQCIDAVIANRKINCRGETCQIDRNSVEEHWFNENQKTGLLLMPAKCLY